MRLNHLPLCMIFFPPSFFFLLFVFLFCFYNSEVLSVTRKVRSFNATKQCHGFLVEAESALHFHGHQMPQIHHTTLEIPHQQVHNSISKTPNSINLSSSPTNKVIEQFFPPPPIAYAMPLWSTYHPVYWKQLPRFAGRPTGPVPPNNCLILWKSGAFDVDRTIQISSFKFKPLPF